MTMRRKPDFSLSPSSLWIDPDAIPRSVMHELTRQLEKSPLQISDSDDQRATFLRFANYLTQEPGHSPDPLQKEHDELELLAQRAHALLAALKGIGDQAIAGMSTFAREVASEGSEDFGSDMADTLRQRDGLSLILGRTWDCVHAIEVIAERTRANMQLSKGAKPAKDRARSMVARLAHYHWQLLGSWPTAGAAGWFGEFAATLGENIGLEVGGSVLKSGIADAKAYGCADDPLKSKIIGAAP